MEQISTRLPVAALADALAQYKDAMRPLLAKDDYMRLCSDSDSFFCGEGKILQARLERYAAELGGESWLREYSRQRFLSLRTPLTIIGNFTLQFRPQSWMHTRSLAENGAALAAAIARLFTELKNDTFPVPQGNDSAVLDEQMRQVLAAVRIPKPDTDEYVRYPDKDCRRFGVFYRNNFYTLALFDDKGAPVSPADILEGLEQILADVRPASSVGFHTIAYGGSAMSAAFYAQLCANEMNRKSLEEAKHTVFNIGLQQTQGDSLAFEKLLFLNTENLWPYKPWSFMLYADGTLAVNNEHTSADGVTNVYLYGYVMDYMRQALDGLERGGSGDVNYVPFKLSAEQTAELLEVKSAYLRQISPYEVSDWERNGIEWDKWKKMGVGRDALIQIAFCYAGERLYHAPRCIHESVSTAHFYQGRTSCLRPVTTQMTEAVNAILTGVRGDELLEKLQSASKAHSAGIKRAKNNICFVRHSAGLLLMQRLFGKELGVNETPTIFTSPEYKRFCSQEISTSTVGASPVVSKFGFAPQVADGIGIGYLAVGDRLSLTYSWDNTQLPNAGGYSHYLSDFFDIIETLLKK